MQYRTLVCMWRFSTAVVGSPVSMNTLCNMRSCGKHSRPVTATFTAIAAINGSKVIHSLGTTATDGVGTFDALGWTQDAQY